MRAIIHPAENHIRIDDAPLTVDANLMPAGVDLEGLSKQPVKIIMFDGVIGTIERVSRVPGRVDVEHFLGADPIKAYVEVHAAETARLAAEKAARDAAQDAADAELHRQLQEAGAEPPAA